MTIINTVNDGFIRKVISIEEAQPGAELFEWPKGKLVIEDIRVIDNDNEEWV